MSKLSPKSTLVLLASLTFSKRFQPREALNKEAVADYTETAKKAKAAGAEPPWPPLKAVKRGDETLIYSGFTRGAALRAAEINETRVEIEENDLITDAEILIKAIAANQANGVRLSNADKLRNLDRLLKEPEYAALSNVAFGDLVGASEYFVRTHRPAAAKPSIVTAVTKSGKTHQVKTKGIGTKGGKKANKKGGAKKPQAEPGAPKDLSQEADRALTRICNVADGHAGLVGSKIKEAVLTGALPLSEHDLTTLSKTADSRIQAALPLVVELGWKPRKAFSFLDHEVKSSTKVEHLINLAIAGGGTWEEKVVDSDGYAVRIFNTKTHAVICEPIKE